MLFLAKMIAGPVMFVKVVSCIVKSLINELLAKKNWDKDAQCSM